MPRVVKAASWAYIVLTVPPEIRGNYRTKKALSRLGKAAMRMLKRHGFALGLRRWHWFGEEGKVYHPHLNCLVSSGYLSKEQIRGLRESWGHILGVDVARVNLKVRICNTPRKILFRVKYITRATFLDWRWDPALARELVGFRNSSLWGAWGGSPAWELEKREETLSGYQVGMLERGLCPEDQTAITWGGVVRGLLLGKHLGGGYWSCQRK